MKFLPEHDEFILQHVGKISHAKIAELFSKKFCKISRASVLGRAWRLKPDKPTYVRPIKPKPAPIEFDEIAEAEADTITANKVKRPKPVKQEPTMQLQTRSSPRLWAFSALPGAFPLNFMEINEKTCKWPIDVEQETMYCGMPIESKTYCVCHNRLRFGRGTTAERLATKG